MPSHKRFLWSTSETGFERSAREIVLKLPGRRMLRAVFLHRRQRLKTIRGYDVTALRINRAALKRYKRQARNREVWVWEVARAARSGRL